MRKGCRSWKLHLPKKGLLQIWWKNHPVFEKKAAKQKGKKASRTAGNDSRANSRMRMRGNNQTRGRREKTWILQAFLQGQIYLKIEIPRKAGNLWIRISIKSKECHESGRCRITGEYDYSEWRIFREYFCSESSDQYRKVCGYQ